MCGQFILFSKFPRGFEDDVDPHALPGECGEILCDGGHGDGFAVNEQVLTFDRNLRVDFPVHGVVFKQVGQGFRPGA
jgi:hypothetical protein